ncbi:uncharacterized protein LOC117122592 [Anneissia japonica]|uniref:uncharacterized protein LOC117122592 n=1 Tax=Anneissia japonica TaxID=1529436 RepID=UPI00142592F2|nr:uncharacterized protein LOC117122592 [Anneissia japonica]
MASNLKKSDIDEITNSLLSNQSFLNIVQNLSRGEGNTAGHIQTPTRRIEPRHQTVNDEMRRLFTPTMNRRQVPLNNPRERRNDRSRSRSRSGSRSKSNVSHQQYIFKEVLLLDKHKCDRVPRPPQLSKLDENGLVYHCVAFEQDMSSDDVYCKLENLFSDVLNTENNNSPIRFEFMIGVGSHLSKARLSDSQGMSAENLHRLYANNKKIYLLPSRDIALKTEISDYLLPSTDTPDETDSTEDEILTECVNCHHLVSSNEHQCNGGGSSHDMACTSKSLANEEDIDFGDKNVVKQKLHDMFPNMSNECFERAFLLARDFNEAIDILTNKSDISKETLINSFRKLRTEELEHLTIRRSNVWRDGLLFYKKSLAQKRMLVNKLCVEFVQEDGVDGGALTVDFFDQFFLASLSELFEKTDIGYIPKRSGANPVPFKILGVAVAHSIMQGGPPFKFLPMWCCSQIGGKSEEVVSSMLSGLSHTEIIPFNAGTSNLISFLNGLNACKSTEAIDKLIDDSAEGPAYEQLVNSSQWPVDTKIEYKNVEVLKNMLIWEEVVSKREKQLQAIKDGLAFAGLLPLMEMCDTEMCSSILLFEDVKMTKDLMMDIVQWDSLANIKEKEWLKELISELSCKDLSHMLKFCTSYSKYDHLSKPMIYLEQKEGKVLPESSVCTTTLFLPVGYTTKEKFKECMEMALQNGHEGFGMA